MHHHSSVVQSTKGKVVPGVSVSVYAAGTLTEATLYSDDSLTALANPVTTDSNGRYDFYIADGKYDLTYSGSGVTPWTDSDVDMNDYKDTSTESGATFKVGALSCSSLYCTGLLDAAAIESGSAIGASSQIATAGDMICDKLIVGDSAGPQLLTGTLDPNVLGVAAPLGSLFIQSYTPKLWFKDGTGDTDWFQITTT